MSKITRPNIQRMTTPTQSNDAWIDRVVAKFINTQHWGKHTEEIRKEAKATIQQHLKQAEAKARIDTIDKVFEMSPKQSFVNWKPTDAFRFYERLKAYEKELQQLNKGDNHD